jgi:hypothetical protein
VEPESEFEGAEATDIFSSCLYTPQFHEVLRAEAGPAVHPPLLAIAVTMLGQPYDVNRSTYSFGVHEQWV